MILLFLFCMVLFVLTVVFAVRGTVLDVIVHDLMFPYVNLRGNIIMPDIAASKEFKLTLVDTSQHGLFVTSSSTIHYLVKGPIEDVDTLVFYCHGNSGTINEWQHVIEEMVRVSPKGTTIITHDYRGYGKSYAYDNPTPKNVVDDAAQLLSMCYKHIRPKKVVLYGRSIGAAVAVHLAALEEIKIDKVCLETPFLGTKFVAVPLVSFIAERWECMHALTACKANISTILCRNDNIINYEKTCHLLSTIKDIDIYTYDGQHNEVMSAPYWHHMYSKLFLYENL